MTHIQEHICGLSGIGFLCPACEVVRANQAKEKPGLSLSIQNDALAISELLDDQRRAVEARDVALLAIRNVLRERFGDDAHRVDLAGLATFIAQQFADLPPPVAEAGQRQEERWNRDYIEPLTRFVKRSRVKPTEGQIEWTLELLAKLQQRLSAQRTSEPTPAEQEKS